MPKPLKGLSTTIARFPLSSVLLLTITSEFPPKRSIVPKTFVEPMLTLPLIVAVLTPRNEMPSGVPPTSSLLVTAMLDATAVMGGHNANTKELGSARNLLLSTVQLQR